jgi:hypothetical protein
MVPKVAAAANWFLSVIMAGHEGSADVHGHVSRLAPGVEAGALLDCDARWRC